MGIMARNGLKVFSTNSNVFRLTGYTNNLNLFTQRIHRTVILSKLTIQPYFKANHIITQIASHESEDLMYWDLLFTYNKWDIELPSFKSTTVTQP